MDNLTLPTQHRRCFLFNTWTYHLEVSLLEQVMVYQCKVRNKTHIQNTQWKIRFSMCFSFLITFKLKKQNSVVFYVYQLIVEHMCIPVQKLILPVQCKEWGYIPETCHIQHHAGTGANAPHNYISGR